MKSDQRTSPPAPVSCEAPKTPCVKPAFRHEKVFETMALACGKKNATQATVQDQQEEFLALGGSVGAFRDPGDLPKNELAAEVVRSFGELRLRVTGSSMLPAIRPGDVLLIRHCRIEQANAGDVVLYLRHRRLFAHRVNSRYSTWLITQGDGVAEPDPPVMADELLGKVIRVMRRGTRISNESMLTFSARIAATLFRFSATAGRLFTLMQGVQHRVSP